MGAEKSTSWQKTASRLPDFLSPLPANMLNASCFLHSTLSARIRRSRLRHEIRHDRVESPQSFDADSFRIVRVSRTQNIVRPLAFDSAVGRVLIQQIGDRQVIELKNHLLGQCFSQSTFDGTQFEFAAQVVEFRGVAVQIIEFVDWTRRDEIG